MKKVLVICGPTAVGKTQLAIKLAKKFKGELVSVDSRQVYKGMDVGTGKDIPVRSKFVAVLKQEGIQDFKRVTKKSVYEIGYRLIQKIPVWLVDICWPDQEFSAAHFVVFANKVIEKIWEKEKLPILVGGTGFWFKALFDGIESLGVPPDWNLREKLAKKTIEELNEELKKLDYLRWQKMNQADRNNLRRLIRAIEIVKQIQNLKGKIVNYNSKLKTKKLLMIGLKTKDYQSLYQRIDKRVEKRLKEGIKREIEFLLSKGYSWNLPSFSATGYRVWQGYFEKKKNQKETIQRWQYEEHNLARRQLTYFKKEKRIKWYEIDKSAFELEIEKVVRQWYDEND